MKEKRGKGHVVYNQCFSTGGPRLGTGPWHQLYRAAIICHFIFLSIFHEFYSGNILMGIIFVNVSKSSDPERLNNICVANVSDQAAYFQTWKYSWVIGNFQTSKSFQHSGKGIPLFMTGHKNCLQADYLLEPSPRLIKKEFTGPRSHICSETLFYIVALSSLWHK
jgi:hypothetical protein